MRVTYEKKGLQEPTRGTPGKRTLKADMHVDVRNHFDGQCDARRLRSLCSRVIPAATREVVRRLGAGVSLRSAPAAANEGAGSATVELGDVVCYFGQPEDVHPDDIRELERRTTRLRKVAKRYGVTLKPVPMAYRGYHLDPRVRRASPNPAERRWSPREKGVDVELATGLLEDCLGPNRPDVVILVSGDADFIPVIQKVMGLKPRVLVMVAACRKAMARRYLDPTLTGFAPIVLDDLLRDAPETRNRKRNRGGHKMTSRKSGNDRPEALSARATVQNPWATQETGRLVVNPPRRARLEVYIKRDERPGATLSCHHDGGRYGVTASVLARYPSPGTYAGWCFVDRRRAVAFFFKEGDRSTPPPPKVSIDTRGDFVNVRGSAEELAAFRDGTLVAFKAHMPSRNGGHRPRRVTRAIDVLSLDGQRPLLLAGLITAGRLAFPDASGIAAALLDTLARNGRSFTGQDARLVVSALKWLAESPDAPSHLRTLAKLELAKRRHPYGESGPDLPDLGGPASPRPPAPTPAPAAGHVEPVHLQLD